MPPQEDRVTAKGMCTQKFVKIGPVVPEICSRTDRQTHTHTHRQTDAHTDGLITILRTSTGAEYDSSGFI